jgi:hypothetical protein
MQRSKDQQNKIHSMGRDLTRVPNTTTSLGGPNTLTNRHEPEGRLKWIRLSTLGVGLVLMYFSIVLLYKEVILGVHVRLGYLALAVACICWILHLASHWAVRRNLVSVTSLKNITVASIAFTVSIVTLDIGFSVYFNITTPRSTFGDWTFERQADPHLWSGESVPYLYYPTEEDFYIYKPSVKKSADTYGEFYFNKLLSSPTLAGSVLELRHISWSIDEHGFRNTQPLNQAHIFALGDSYVIGWSIDQEKTWVERLAQKIAKPVYNLGVSGISPKQELMLLKYLLHTNPESMKIEHLLWVIFEGNDLEDYYETFRSQDPHESNESRNPFAGTIEEALHSIPLDMKEESVINRLRERQIVFTHPSFEGHKNDHYEVDGIPLVDPLYHSTKYGYRMFRKEYIERAGKPESYVLNHPNRPLLDQTFKEMEALRRKYSFKVTVLLAPSAPRLYARYFEDLPPISNEPFFLNYVKDLAHSAGFEVVDLNELLQPCSAKELLYWRDDTHWNERGNEIVAEILRRSIGTTLVSSDGVKNNLHGKKQLGEL